MILLDCQNPRLSSIDKFNVYNVIYMSVNAFNDHNVIVYLYEPKSGLMQWNRCS